MRSKMSARLELGRTRTTSPLRCCDVKPASVIALLSCRSVSGLLKARLLECLAAHRRNDRSLDQASHPKISDDGFEEHGGCRPAFSWLVWIVLCGLEREEVSIELKIKINLMLPVRRKCAELASGIRDLDLSVAEVEVESWWLAVITRIARVALDQEVPLLTSQGCDR